MTIHAGSLEQFMLSRRMEAEITRQKTLPPRWKRPMIFRTAEQALHFVERQYKEAGPGSDDAWNRAKVIIAMTRGYYSWPQQAQKVLETLVRMDGVTETETCEHGGMRIVMARHAGETEIHFHVAEERHAFRFMDYEDACVLVGEEVEEEETAS